MTEFDIIRNEGRLAYEYVRGSRLYNLNTPASDCDTGGVYLCSRDEFFSLYGCRSQVSDERHDNTWYEIGELLRLLLKSNPTVLEAVFVPNDKIIGPVHPLMRLILDNRDRFVTRQCFMPFSGYAKSQIEKARGLNKKIVNPIEKRLLPMDFTYAIVGHGSMPFAQWLRKRGLRQRYCGLVNVSNMRDMRAVYYDFGEHCVGESGWESDMEFLSYARQYFGVPPESDIVGFLSGIRPFGYRGTFNEEKDGSEIRLSSIAEGSGDPICFISYNNDAYQQHCRAHADYQRWVRMRNPERYKANLDKNYDSKNMMHMFRLIHMASEIAEGRGVILERTYDRQFLMDVRAHRYEYDELMAILEEERARMEELMAASTIPERVDADFVNNLMLEIRKRQFA